MASWPDLAVVDEKCLDEKSWEVIGSGGFAQVSKVRHRQWSRDVAIKLLGLDDGTNADEDLLRESKLMRQAESPHVTKVLAVFRGHPPVSLYGPGIQIGLVMELMERGSLTSLQKKLNHPPLCSLVFRLAHQVALGMEHLHSLDPPIIHKDLKPDNVLLDTGLNVKITDFGISKFADTVTSDHIKGAGTTKYMPPEALISLSYTSNPAFDVYSYGLLLWFIMTGKVPYEGSDNILIELLIPKGNRPSLDAINTEQAPEMKDLVKLMERCWVHEADQRPIFPDCSAVTGPLYERNKSGIEHAVNQVITELDQKDITDGFSTNQPSVMDLLIDPILTIATTLHSLCEEVRANKKRCTRLKDRVEGLKQVLRATKRKGGQISANVYTALDELKLTLESATAVVKYNADEESLIKRISNSSYEFGDEIESLNNRLNDAFQSLTLNLLVEVDPNLHKLFDSASQQEEDEAARKEDCAEMQKMLQQLLERGPQSQIPSHCVETSEIIPKDTRTIFPEDLTFDYPKEPFMTTDISEVYKGEYKKYPVAIKRYQSDAKRIFEGEIDTMTCYASPHILRMFGVCFQGDDGLIVMEYCEKGSLREVLDNSRLTLRWDRKARMCLDAAQGIYRLHQSEEKSKLHMSISSSKFMVAEGYRVKLGGLELAQTETSLRRTKNPEKSSLLYRSPEQLDSVNHQNCKICEIYSLGIVLWEIATLKKPFDDCTTDLHIHKRVCEEKRGLEPLPEDCPKKLGQLINDCLGYDAFQRPSAGVLVDELCQVVEQLEEE